MTVLKRGSVAALAFLDQERGIICHPSPQALLVGKAAGKGFCFSWLHVFNGKERVPR